LPLIAMNSSEQSVSQVSGEDAAFIRCAEAVERNAASSRQSAGGKCMLGNDVVDVPSFK